MQKKSGLLAAAVIGVGLLCSSAQADPHMRMERDWRGEHFRGEGYHHGGVPHGYYRHGGGGVYLGIYDRRDYPDRYWRDDRPVRGRLTCREAEFSVRRFGYRVVDVLDCGGARYRFIAHRRGEAWRLVVNAWTGRIERVSPAGFR